MHTRHSEEDSDNPAEERSPEADENAIRASRGGSRGWLHRDHWGVRHWDGRPSDGGGDVGLGAAEGDEGLGGVWWGRGDGDEGRTGGVEGLGGVVGDDDGAATGSVEAGSDEDGDGWRGGGYVWRGGVADGAWAV